MDTCQALWEVLHDEVIPSPTGDDWLKIAEEFERKWNFPNRIGALDGKHVVIQAQPNSGFGRFQSHIFNYKGTFSIILMALVDASYCFRAVSAYGRNSDGGIFAESEFGQLLQSGRMNVPLDRPLPGTDKSLPFVIVEDEALPLKRYIMRPYPGRDLTCIRQIFNYSLSRARIIVENAFGMLAKDGEYMRGGS